ncbi:hypothetical protein [Oceanispirochaeta sp.]|jgi:multimeric flavodoxin WrbA|uniref:hypothetical protein n=1 Tax=Oceanispirochaeta sp. TaxID=2035350 RepID=UPI002618D7B7|nr:hypothetical protein [Oceanispirochaeta sp.]MDA3955415.1 hypothetical protein [Oceanispirochaeta sp.]
MKKILYICGSPRSSSPRGGSPRGESGSNSAQILKDLGQYLTEEGLQEDAVSIHTLSRSIPDDPSEVLKKLDDCEVWILALPLYVDALPGHLSWWLSRYQEYRASNNDKKDIRVYGIVNCGFPEAIQNRDALKILELFCLKSGLIWRFGIGLGMGEPYKQMAGMPLRSRGKRQVFEAFQTLAADLKNSSGGVLENAYVAVKFPKWLYRVMGSMGWIMSGRKNGLKRKDLYARPLLTTLTTGESSRAGIKF